MTQFVVPPTNYEVKLKDGTKYRPNSSGTIEVDNKRHIAEIKNSHAKQSLDMIKEKTWTAGSDASVEGRICDKCLFAAYKWTTRCPRCDSPITTKPTKG